MSDTLSILALQSSGEAEWHSQWTAYPEYYESTVSEEVYQANFARLVDAYHSQQRAALAL